ncbi:nuclear RNA export factor 2-like [Orussus abietinus]|uniref:nuclear RNA export factor 2-like n=1 Tax=Orussus abietinus TaxID=222816 RepID=UPI0006263B45|nr:nuclear RNA export factor 2-like [Orussus abietinus]
MMSQRVTMTTSEMPNNSLSWEPLRLTHLKPSFNNNEVALAGCQDLWHKFIIFNAANHKMPTILTAVIVTCEPEVLIPVMYKMENENKCVFLAKCTLVAIENLVKQNLTIMLPSGQVLYMDIVLGFLDTQNLMINPSKAVTHALYYRYEPAKKILNLDNFENDKNLGPMYCPLSAPRVFLFVLRCAKMGILGNARDMKLPVRELSLRNNGITAIMPYEKFFNYHLTKLDLRHNKIDDVDYLRYFSEFRITELWLDGNPLCTRYNTSEEYIQAIKLVFPHLQKLDGISIGVEKKFVPMLQPHYLGDGSRSGLIKQFVKHYFMLFDQEDRIVMHGLYDTDAFFSMTLVTTSNYVHRYLSRLVANNRNLLKFVDYAKCHEFLLQGPERIINALRRHPITVHNLKTFNIDLLHVGSRHAVISVQGLFSYKQLPGSRMSFNRTFIIVAKEDNEYCIVNDQYHIDNAPSIVDNKDLRQEVKEVPIFKPTLFSPSEKEQLLGFLHELTSMNLKFCQRYLEDANWNIRGAIINFMKSYTVNDVPPEAFR